MKTKLTGSLVTVNSITIDAPIGHVWKLQTSINDWPSWQNDITSAELLGPLQKGSQFKWKAMGMNILSELQEVVQRKVIGWTGVSIGMRAVHYWYFEKQGSKTKVTTEESLSGWLPSIIKIFKPDFLEDAVAKSLETLKMYSEKTK